jgi:phage tail sheath protein FI
MSSVNKNSNNETRGQPNYPGVYINEVPSGVRAIAGVATSITAFIGRAQKGPLDEPVAITTYGDFERVFGGLWNEGPMSFAVNDYFLNGGNQALIVRIDDDQYVDKVDEISYTQIIGNEDDKTGLYALEKVDLFNILCIPPTYENDDLDMSVITAAADYCEKRHAILILDCPRAWHTKQEAISGMSNPLTSLGTDNKNAAVFFPRILKPNPLRNNKIETFAPCGAIAGVIARTDVNRGIWKAPAGVEAILNGVTGLSVTLTDTENGELNNLGCNCLHLTSTAGPVVIWGARTLQGNDMISSEWKYIPVRRLALFIEESIYWGMQWVVFEPNDESLWAKIRLNISAFMYSLFRDGALQGVKPSDAYFVKCDNETTTQNDIGGGIVNIQVGFAPLKPQEFITLCIQHKTEQS